VSTLLVKYTYDHIPYLSLLAGGWVSKLLGKTLCRLLKRFLQARRFFVAVGRRVENRFFGHNHQPIVRLSDFSEILYEEAQSHADKSHVTKTANFKKYMMATAAILKIVKSLYRSEKSSDFDEICYTTADMEPDDSH